jgi:hypothetical protein
MEQQITRIFNLRATFGGPSHGSGVNALHLAAQDDQVAMVELLL